MPKMDKVTDAEIKACHIAADDLLSEMHDFINRMEKGYVDRLEDPANDARQFALIAQAASTMVCKILSHGEMQRQRDELNKLRS